MAKFHGTIGYIKTVEVEPGIWDNQVIEHEYYGEILKNSRNFGSATEINDGVNISNNISIVADPYATENFQYMRYIEIRDIKWKIVTVTIEYPRLVLSIGGVYNG